MGVERPHHHLLRRRAALALGALGMLAAGCSSGTESIATDGPRDSSSATTLPTHTLPANTLPANTLPANTLPANTLPASSGPPTSTVDTPAAPSPQGYKLAWSDEFDGAALDPGRWGYESPLYGSGAGSVHIYDQAAVSVDNGLLRISATRLPDPLRIDDDNDGADDRQLEWRSGFITTERTHSFTYGYVEVRARMPHGAGLWPAVWLRPHERAYGSWPRSGEMDIVESLGHAAEVAHTTAHWWDDGHRKDAAATELVPNGDGFHTYVLQWEPGRLTWFIDDTPVHTLDDWVTDVASPPAPFDSSFFLNINLAVGGSWPGPPDASTPDGAVLEVDWIRVHQPENEAN